MQQNKQEINLERYFFKELGWGSRRNQQAKLVFDLLVEASEFVSGGVLLDAGAGHQRYKPFFHSSIYLSQEHPDGIKFKGMQKIKYDFIDPIDQIISLKNSSLDGILSTSVIEHLKRPDLFAKEAFRVLKPGGKVFINTPFFIAEHEKPYDFNRQTRFGLEQLFKSAGFVSVKVFPTTSSVRSIATHLPLAVFTSLIKRDMSVPEYVSLISKKPFFVKISLFVGLFFTLVLMMLAKLSSVFFLMFDRGWFDESGCPIGWIAIATKKGNVKRIDYKSKQEFLVKRRLK